MGKIPDLRAQAQRKTTNIYDTLFTRRVSIYLTAALRPLGATPNQVSVAGLLTGLTACGLIAIGNKELVIAGAALIHLYAVLDSVDGELARLSQRFSLKGLFIEDVSAYLMTNAVNLAVASYLLRTANTAVPLYVAVFIAAFARNAMPVARRAWLKSIATRRPVAAGLPAQPSSDALPKNKVWKVFRYVVQDNLLHSMTICVELSIVILVEVMGGFTGSGLVLYCYYLLMAGLILKELAIYGYLLRGNSLEQQLLGIYQSAAQGPRKADSAVDGIALANY